MNYGLNSVEILDEDDQTIFVTIKVTHIGGDDPDDGPEWEVVDACKNRHPVDLTEDQKNEAFDKLLS